jgi:hypothetical protein
VEPGRRAVLDPADLVAVSRKRGINRQAGPSETRR